MPIRSHLLACVLCASACSTNGPPPEAPQSPCTHQQFEGAGFIVCTPPAGSTLKLFAAGKGEPPKRHFRDLGVDERRVAFAMNAGMFDEVGRAIGLAITDGRQVHPIALRAGGGNFGMKPNGVFEVTRDGRARIVISERFESAPNVPLATQSGPMLVIDGKVNAKFDPDGESRHIRNAVGIAPDGRPRFVISEDSISFGKLARFFRDKLGSRNALYLDGSVSSLWSPADGRMDDVTDLGPIIVAVRPLPHPQ